MELGCFMPRKVRKNPCCVICKNEYVINRRSLEPFCHDCVNMIFGFIPCTTTFLSADNKLFEVESVQFTKQREFYFPIPGEVEEENGVKRFVPNVDVIKRNIKKFKESLEVSDCKDGLYEEPLDLLIKCLFYLSVDSNDISPGNTLIPMQNWKQCEDGGDFFAEISAYFYSKNKLNDYFAPDFEKLQFIITAKNGLNETFDLNNSNMPYFFKKLFMVLSSAAVDHASGNATRKSLTTPPTLWLSGEFGQAISVNLETDYKKFRAKTLRTEVSNQKNTQISILEGTPVILSTIRIESDTENNLNVFNKKLVC